MNHKFIQYDSTSNWAIQFINSGEYITSQTIQQINNNFYIWCYKGQAFAYKKIVDYLLINNLCAIHKEYKSYTQLVLTSHALLELI
jgi:hypothetical protein